MENIDLNFVFSNLTGTTYLLHIKFNAAAGFLSAVTQIGNRIEAFGCLFAKYEVGSG